tara:strand:+ start:1106 stop:1318 length:213 start_codon:yes stop_codon:yes gene_type:complete
LKVIREHNCGREIAVELLGPLKEAWFYDFWMKPGGSLQFQNLELCPECGVKITLKNLKPDPRIEKGVLCG